MPKKGESGKTKPCNILKCQSCEGSPEFEKDEFIEHLEKVHGLGKDTKYVRTMLSHADAKEWYSYTFQWEEKKPNGVRFQQYIVELRSDEDRAYWGA